VGPLVTSFLTFCLSQEKRSQSTKENIPAKHKDQKKDNRGVLIFICGGDVIRKYFFYFFIFYIF